MGGLSSRAWLLAALVGIITGCSSTNTNTRSTSPFRRNNPQQPPDPLLLSKTPMQARYGTAVDPPPHPEPFPPAKPPGAWAVAPAAPNAARLGIPGHDVVSPYHWTSERVPFNERAPARNSSFPWLQGTLEKTPKDQWVLRCDAGTPMPPGGKVLLQGHPRLDLFEGGEVIRVAGHLIEEKEPRSSGSWLPHSHYHVERVDLVRRKSR